MTTPAEPQTNVVVESKTSVKLTRNSKGVTWEIKLVDGTPAEEVDRLVSLAIDRHNNLLSRFPA